MKRLMVVLAVASVFIVSLAVFPVMAQPVDYCEGNFDNDLDQDGTDAFVFKKDFGRSSLSNPCPQIACQTAEQLEMRIVQLETLLANVTRVGNDITFSGVNVHIVDGSGDTWGTVNGRGNLIVGYNELRGGGDNRTGSHNIVVGSGQNYSSYGGLVAGYYNTISGTFASVSGGIGNIASGEDASVSGGTDNTASGVRASVSGGYSSTASGWGASVSGGISNIASGEDASVSGGRYNEASGDYSFVGGGGYTDAYYGNKAFGHYSAILGGVSNIAGDSALADHTIGEASTVSGGGNNAASGSVSSVSGGGLNTASGSNATVSGGRGNEVSGSYASISGGQDNIASAWNSSVSGGQENTASGDWASISGGRNNQAMGDYSFVGGGGSYNPLWGNFAVANYSAILGGAFNTAGDPTHVNTSIGEWSTVGGGRGNNASGVYSKVSGGGGRSVTGADDWVAGGLFQDN